MILFALVVFLSFLYGYMVVASLLTISMDSLGAKVMFWGLIPGTGIAIFSLVSFVALYFVAGDRILFILYHCLFVSIAWILFTAVVKRKPNLDKHDGKLPNSEYMAKKTIVTPHQTSDTRDLQLSDEKKIDTETSLKVIRIITGVVVFAAIGAFILSVLTKPNGEWDTFAIWNLCARYIFLSGSYWREGFHNRGFVGVTHPDYPLLLPAFISGGWIWMGREALVMPAYSAFCFTFSTVAVLWGALRISRSETTACIAVIILLGARLFVLFGGWEQADVPLGYFLLSSLAVWFATTISEDYGINRRILILTALEVGFAAWTKNEGIMDALIVSLVFAFAALRREENFEKRGVILSWIYGLTLPVSILLWFKMTLAPPNDIMSGQGWHRTFARLTDILRYKIIIVKFVKEIIGFSPGPRGIIPMMILYRWIAGKSKYLTGTALVTKFAIIILFILIGDFAVYLITPKDLPWQLTSSFDRLLIQIWPSVVFIYCLTTNFLEKGSLQFASEG